MNLLLRCALLLVVGVPVAGLPVVVSAGSPSTQMRVRFNEGILAFNDRDYANARQIFAEIVAQRQDDPAAHYWLGLCRLQLDDYAGAAQSLTRVLELSPEMLEVNLDLAIALAGDDRFEVARAPLETFIASNRGDPRARSMAHFFLGIVDYKTRRFDAALAAFDRAGEGFQADDARSTEMKANISWYRGWILVEQRQFEAATAAFMDVVEKSPSADLQARSTTLADEIGSGDLSAVEPQTRVSFRLDLGFNFDTNVVLLGDDTSLPIDLSTDDDFRFGLGTDARVLTPLNSDWLLGFGLNTFNSWHASLQEFNVQTYGGRLFLNWFPDDRVIAGLAYEYEYTLVENDAFLDRHRVTPSLRLIEQEHEDGTTATATTLYYVYEPRDYHDDITDRRTIRDGDYHTVGLTQMFNIHQPLLEAGDPRWLQASVGYRWQTHSTVGDDFDMTGHVLSARLAWPLPYDMQLDLSGEWTWEDYWQPNSDDFRRRNREDFVQRYRSALSREFEIDRGITLALQGHVEWTQDDSNVRNSLREAIYSYDRWICGVTVSLFFD